MKKSAVRKTIFFVVVVFLIFLLTKTYLDYRKFNEFYEDLIEKHISEIGQLLLQKVYKIYELGLNFNEVSALNEELEYYQKIIKNIETIAIIDNDYNILCANDLKIIKKKFTDLYNQNFQFSNNIVSVKTSAKNKNSNMLILPIMNHNQSSSQKSDNNINYYLVIKYFYTPITNLYIIRDNFFISILIAFILIILLLFFLFYNFTKPINKITKQLAEVINLKKYDFTIFCKSNDIEFVTLTDYINKLLFLVSEREQQLIEYNSNLSEQIKRHTEKLHQTILELKLTNEKLIKADAVKDEFLSVVTHELKTPITTIRAYVETLQSGMVDDSEKNNFYEIILLEITRLTRLINNVLDISRLERKQINIKKTQVYIAELIKKIIDGLQPELKEKKIICVDNTNDFKDLMLETDKDKITQVIYNLVNNAIKFNKRNGRIEILLSIISNPHTFFKRKFYEKINNGKYLVIIVEDYGIGIRPEKINLIWEKFTRVSDDYYEGTGLGLTLVYNFIRLLDGDIFVESEFGKFTKFTVLIPLN